MLEASYGLNQAADNSSELDASLEEISLQGYTVIQSVFDQAQLETLRMKIHAIYQQQVLKTGQAILSKIGDENICRCPMAYDHDFVAYASTPQFLKIAEYFLDDYFILGVQNANISQPMKTHAQSAWHRDLPYQNFTSSKPLGINFLVAIDDFTEENGGIVVMPFSHKMESIPSLNYISKHAKTITAKAGDVISFDSMLIHRAGVNHSKQERLSFNHMYTRPFIKQQYDYASIMQAIPGLSSQALKFSGASSRTARDDVDWRAIRLQKMFNETRSNKV